METSNDMTTKFDETIDKIKEIEAKYNNLVISKQELMEKYIAQEKRLGFLSIEYANLNEKYDDLLNEN
jgi:hypothetical protein